MLGYIKYGVEPRELSHNLLTHSWLPLHRSLYVSNRINREIGQNFPNTDFVYWTRAMSDV